MRFGQHPGTRLCRSRYRLYSNTMSLPVSRNARPAIRPEAAWRAARSRCWERLQQKVEAKQLQDVCVTASGCLSFCRAGPLMYFRFRGQLIKHHFSERQLRGKSIRHMDQGCSGSCGRRGALEFCGGIFWARRHARVAGRMRHRRPMLRMRIVPNINAALRSAACWFCCSTAAFWLFTSSTWMAFCAPTWPRSAAFLRRSHL